MMNSSPPLRKARSRVRREGLTHLAECVIAIAVAVAMVECAEVIDVDEEDGCLLPRAFLRPEHESFQIGKSPAITQPRQDIRVGFDGQRLDLRTQAKDRVGELRLPVQRLANIDPEPDHLIAAA